MSPFIHFCDNHSWERGCVAFRLKTGYVERQNLTMRMQMRRFTRLTNAFSKKWEYLDAAISLHFFYYNFIRIHLGIKNLGKTRAYEVTAIGGSKTGTGVYHL